MRNNVLSFMSASCRIFGLAAMVVVATSCGKETRGPTDGAVDAQTSDIMGSNVASTADALGRQQSAVDAVRREVAENDETYRALIDAEREERKEEDTRINSRIDSLVEELDALQQKLIDEVARLDKADADLLAKIEANDDAVEQKIVALQQADVSFAADLSKLANDLRKEMTDAIAKLDEEHATARAALAVEIAGAQEELDKRLTTAIDANKSGIDAVNESLTLKIAGLKADLDGLDKAVADQKKELQDKMADDKKVLVELLDKNRADLESRLTDVDTRLTDELLKLAKAQEDFKVHVAQVYATKSELARVEGLVQGLERVTNVLGKKIDVNDDAVRDLVSKSVLTLREEFSTKVKAVEAQVDQVKGALLGHIKIYQDEMASMQNNISIEFFDIRNAMITMRGDLLRKQVEGDASIRKEVGKVLEARSMEFELLAQSMRKDLSDQIIVLGERIDGTDATLAQAKIDAQKALNQAIAAEQHARAKIQAEVAALTKELDEVASDVKSLQKITEVQSVEIRKLRIDFEAEKVVVAKRFSLQDSEIKKLNDGLGSVRAEMKDQIADVAETAAKMVANLGDNVQKQFRKVASDMAEFEQKQVATAAALNHFMAEVRGDKVLQEQFERDVVRPRQDSIVALANFVSEMSNLELAFIKVLNPDQKAPGFYDTSFKPIMLKCGGNSQASFANAFGYDSFQFLAQEYARHLVFGARGTSSDGMFHGVAKLLSTENLHKLTVMTSLNYTVGSDSEVCVQDVQVWARGVLFGADGNAKGLQAKLAANADLARAVLKFKDAIAAMKLPLDRLEAVIRASLKGQADAEKILLELNPARPPLLPRYAISILEAARNQFALIERQEIYNRVVAVQESLAADDAVLGQRVMALKGEFESKLASFRQETNVRISALEGKMGAMSSSLKKALDVVLTMAARSGYSDLVAEAVAAGKSIGYTPVEIPVFAPRILEVQHFFGAPALANNTDTCTGAQILQGAGVIKGKQCWVNFRRIPSSQWVGTVNSLWFRIFGSAHKIAISAPSYAHTFDFRNSNNDPDMTVHGTYAQGVFDFKASDALVAYTASSPAWSGVKLTFTPVRVSGTTEIKGNAQSYTIQLYSPIVMDFRSVGQIGLKDSTESGVKFDLMDTGQKVSTGWVSDSDVGILALDLDNSGRIESGRELFGQATVLPDGTRAEHGYQALAQYDSNHDGVIDARDPVFHKLVVWFDRDGDGISNSAEMRPLAAHGVTSISLDYAKVNGEAMYNAGNVVKYEARFHGPSSCPAGGCKTYDVFFGTSVSVASK